MHSKVAVPHCRPCALLVLFVIGVLAGAWVEARAGTALALATESTEGGRAMMLVGASEPVEIKLPTGIAGTLQFRATASVNQECR